MDLSVPPWREKKDAPVQPSRSCNTELSNSHKKRTFKAFVIAMRLYEDVQGVVW